MKKFSKFFALILVLVVVIFAFSACLGNEGEFSIVVIRDGVVEEYVLDSTGSDMTYLVDAFKALEEDENSGFSYMLNGTFLTTINGYTATTGATSGEFWAIYTDCEIDGIKYYDTAWGTADYEGVTCGSALKGVTELPLNGGSTYIVKLSTY